MKKISQTSLFILASQFSLDSFSRGSATACKSTINIVSTNTQQLGCNISGPEIRKKSTIQGSSAKPSTAPWERGDPVLREG
jgi:hypothetical protein